MLAFLGSLDGVLMTFPFESPVFYCSNEQQLCEWDQELRWILEGFTGTGGIQPKQTVPNLAQEQHCQKSAHMRVTFLPSVEQHDRAVNVAVDSLWDLDWML